MDVADYLERIGCRGALEPDLATLRDLHVAHLRTVPFENLDITLGRPIQLSLEAIYDKIVSRRRGGFCYELNGLFGWLLESLGFETELLSARVYQGEECGPEFDHMLVLVHGDQDYLADVGFGDSFREPQPLDGEPRVEGDRGYRIATARVDGSGDEVRSADRILEQRDGVGAWCPQFRFSLRGHELAAFRPMCDYQQSSPESHFTRKSVCSLATATGRITLSGNRLIHTGRDGRREEVIANLDEYHRELRVRFGIEIPRVDLVANLLAAPPPA